MGHRVEALAGLLLLCLATALAFQGPRLLAQTSTTGRASPCRSRPQQCVSPRPPAWLASAGKARPRAVRPLRVAGEGTAAETPEGETPQVPSTATAIVKVESEEGEGRGFFNRVARFFGAGKAKPNIKELGLYALLSYGFVSNASYAICVGLAWFAASKKSGLSPLAPNQWQVFLVSYAACFAINNVLRVPRFALSVSLAPAFDRFIAFLMRKTGRGKAVATGLCVFLVNVLGTITLMTTGILLASVLSGVPFWPVGAA